MIVVYGYGFLAIFYTCFMAYASIQNVGWSRVPKFGKVCLLPVGVIFYVMDLVFNAFATLIFLQLPTMKTSTLSLRLKANIAGPDGWRKRWSSLFVGQFLLPFTSRY